MLGSHVVGRLLWERWHIAVASRRTRELRGTGDFVCFDCSSFLRRPTDGRQKDATALHLLRVARLVFGLSSVAAQSLLSHAQASFCPMFCRKILPKVLCLSLRLGSSATYYALSRRKHASRSHHITMASRCNSRKGGKHAHPRPSFHWFC
jgi:hypothetical protein